VRWRECSTGSENNGRQSTRRKPHGSSSRAESAVLCHASSLGDALDRFACHAAKHAEQTARLVDRLLWHGDAAALLRLLETIWPAYRDDEGILDWAKDDLSSLARTLLVDRHIDAGGLAADPMLRGQVELFSSDGGDAATFIALADPKSARRWSLEELQRSSRWERATRAAPTSKRCQRGPTCSRKPSSLTPWSHAAKCALRSGGARR